MNRLPECEYGTYGDECKETCGHCYGNVTCDKTWGNCQKCSSGYTGNQCIKGKSTEIQRFKHFDGTRNRLSTLVT